MQGSYLDFITLECHAFGQAKTQVLKNPKSLVAGSGVRNLRTCNHFLVESRLVEPALVMFFLFLCVAKGTSNICGGCSLISTSIGDPQTHSLGRLFSRAFGPADGGPCAKMAAPSKVRTLCVPREKFQAALKGLWRHLWEMRRNKMAPAGNPKHRWK